MWALLMWSLFLTAHLCLSTIWPKLLVKSRHQKDTCRNEIGVCVQNVDSRCSLADVKFESENNGEGLCDHVKEFSCFQKKESSL